MDLQRATQLPADMDVDMVDDGDVDAVSKAKGGGKGKHGKGKPNPNKDKVCRYCSKKGHVENECRKKTADAKGKAGGGGGGKAAKDVKCYNCQGTGHYARDCKKPRKKGKGGGKGQHSLEEDASAAQEQDSLELCCDCLDLCETLDSLDISEVDSEGEALPRLVHSSESERYVSASDSGASDSSDASRRDHTPRPQYRLDTGRRIFHYDPNREDWRVPTGTSTDDEDEARPQGHSHTVMYVDDVAESQDDGQLAQERVLTTRLAFLGLEEPRAAMQQFQGTGTSSSQEPVAATAGGMTQVFLERDEATEDEETTTRSDLIKGLQTEAADPEPERWEPCAKEEGEDVDRQDETADDAELARAIAANNRENIPRAVSKEAQAAAAEITAKGSLDKSLEEIREDQKAARKKSLPTDDASAMGLKLSALMAGSLPRGRSARRDSWQIGRASCRERV